MTQTRRRVEDKHGKYLSSARSCGHGCGAGRSHYAPDPAGGSLSSGQVASGFTLPEGRSLGRSLGCSLGRSGDTRPRDGCRGREDRLHPGEGVKMGDGPGGGEVIQLEPTMARSRMGMYRRVITYSMRCTQC